MSLFIFLFYLLFAMSSCSLDIASMFVVLFPNSNNNQRSELCIVCFLCWMLLLSRSCFLRSRLQDVVELYTKELLGMSYAANTGKESNFLERCVSNGKYCTLLLRCHSADNIGKVRTILDIGCGYDSFGAHLFSKELLTMCVASYEASGSQVQLTLERGLPAMIGSITTNQLSYPSLSYDMVLYFYCRCILVDKNDHEEEDCRN